MLAFVNDTIYSIVHKLFLGDERLFQTEAKR